MSQSVYQSTVSLPSCMPRPAPRSTRTHRSSPGRTSGVRRHDGRRPVGRDIHRETDVADRPDYRRRRVGAAVLAVFSIALVAVVLVTIALVAEVAIGLLAGSGGRPASASRAEPAHIATAVHVAVAGDSLWSIAQANHAEVGVERYVDALIDLNGGTSVLVGQAVRLP